MALDGHIGPSKAEARQRERACFIEAWTHQALVAALRDQDEAFSQLEKLSDYRANATFLAAEVEKLDAELKTLKETLAEGDLVAQFLSVIRRACQEAAERGENLYFFGDRAAEV